MRQEFELTIYDFAVQLTSNKATGTSSIEPAYFFSFDAQMERNLELKSWQMYRRLDELLTALLIFLDYKDWVKQKIVPV